LVWKAKARCNDPGPAPIEAHDISIRNGPLDRFAARARTSGHCDPQDSTLIEVDKIHRTQRFTGEAVEDGVVFPASRETMNSTGADIRNQQLSRRLQSEAVGRSGYTPDYLL